MADFETRVREALIAGVVDGPSSDSLRESVRARRRRRMQRRLAAAVGVAVVLAVAVPLAVVGLSLGGDGADSAGTAIDNGRDGRWRTVTYRGVEVDVPPGWERLGPAGCGSRLARYGSPGVDPCRSDLGLFLTSSATVDVVTGPGLRATAPSADLPEGGWGGYVEVGQLLVDVDDPSRAVAARVLASARVAGEDPPEPSSQVRRETWRGLSVDVPLFWFAQEAPCVRAAEPGDPAVEFPGKGSRPNCTYISQGYGARFFDSSLNDPTSEFQSGRISEPDPRLGYPDGAWVGQITAVGPGLDPGVVVVAHDRASVQRVLDSVRYRNKPVSGR